VYLLSLSINNLKNLCNPDNIFLTLHAAKRLEQRGILLDEVISCIMSGEIIEEYPNDYPYPSCLVLGNLDTKSPLHVVIGSNFEQLWIITAYYPSMDKWKSDLKTRKEN